MKWQIQRFGSFMLVFLIALIGLYQLLISPLLGLNCRHLPSCSQYAKDALKTHGPLRGIYFALKRILRCHPWVEPMVDPVPPLSGGSKYATKVKGK